MTQDPGYRDLADILIRRLDKLNEQREKFGPSTPDDILQEIDQLESQLDMLYSQQENGEIEVEITKGGGGYSLGDTDQGEEPVSKDAINYGDKIAGEAVMGDSISVGDLSGSGIAIGRGTPAQQMPFSEQNNEYEKLFVPVTQVVSQAPSEIRKKAMEMSSELLSETSKREFADDNRMGMLIEDLVNLVPETAGPLLDVFSSPLLEATTGPVTRYVLERHSST